MTCKSRTFLNDIMEGTSCMLERGIVSIGSFHFVIPCTVNQDSGHSKLGQMSGLKVYIFSRLPICRLYIPTYFFIG
jgi:hypothetical protein